MNGIASKKIVFLHMHKTGGSDIAAQFYGSRFGKYFFPESLRAVLGFLPADMLESYRFFYGHQFRKFEIDNIPGEKFLITFLRDPVERVISHYEWLASYRLDIEGGVIPQPETIPVKTMSCAEFFGSRMIDVIEGFNNYYTRAIYGFFHEKETTDIDLMLEAVIRKLDAFDFVGTLDNYAASLDHLGRMLDIRFDDPAMRPKINVTASLTGENGFHEGGRCFEADVGTLEHIRVRNRADIELYRHVKQMAEERFGIAQERVISGLSTQGIVHHGYAGSSLYIDVAGHLQFGPYERINAGDYVVNFSLRIASLFSGKGDPDRDVVVAILDFVGFDNEAREFAKREVTRGELSSARFSTFQLPISLELPVSMFECRIYSTGACELESPVSMCITPAATGTTSVTTPPAASTGTSAVRSAAGRLNLSRTERAVSAVASGQSATEGLARS